jgi:UDP-N-acetylglucosamine 2-epimerase (non-hydrolysing)
MKKILFILGTRPEAIKLAPLIKEFQKNEKEFIVKICVTAQHRRMLDQVLSFFAIKPDYDLNIMKPDQSLYNIMTEILVLLEKVLNKENPDIVFVQGDTTTAFVGALASYYKRINIAHIEAGLRSFNKYSPFPEEINRTLIGHIADFHFAPTLRAKKNLENEGIKKNIWVIGNTVIDSLFWGLKIIDKEKQVKYKDFFSFIDFTKRLILITGHRRESFGEGFNNICNALRDIISMHKDIEIIYPVHLIPNVRVAVNKILKGVDGIHLIEPLDYPYMIWLMSKAYLILTDSGGIQEEAPSLGKPVLVMREVTERTEGIEAGTAKLIGVGRNKIVSEVEKLLNNGMEYDKMSKAVNPYGDGKSSEKIFQAIKEVIK